jgi:hypothetical protein
LIETKFKKEIKDVIDFGGYLVSQSYLNKILKEDTQIFISRRIRTRTNRI